MSERECEGWLWQQLQSAAEEFATWPEWKQRELYARAGKLFEPREEGK